MIRYLCSFSPGFFNRQRLGERFTRERSTQAALGDVPGAFQGAGAQQRDLRGAAAQGQGPGAMFWLFLVQSICLVQYIYLLKMFLFVQFTIFFDKKMIDYLINWIIIVCFFQFRKRNSSPVGSEACISRPPWKRRRRTWRPRNRKQTRPSSNFWRKRQS